MDNTAKLPSWMLESEDYSAQKDHDGFVTKSILTLMSILKRAKNPYGSCTKTAAPIKILFTLFLIVLISCSHNMMFSYIVAAMVIVRLCLLPGHQLLHAVRTAFFAAVLSLIILIPAVFFGSPSTMFTVSIKVFLSVSMVMITALTTPWNELTEGLRFFFLPDIFIFTLDITLKYIVMLGDLCLDMLTALRLRSIGKNKTKNSSFSGVLGSVFLKSREMAEEMHGAMCCRGFEGQYKRYRFSKLTKSDIFPIALMVLALVVFIYMERI